jgi:excisionase family DNA binding protein
MAERDERWLTPIEVARLLRVTSKTVGRWADLGHLHSVRTLGGHRRFRPSDVSALMRSGRAVGTLSAEPIPAPRSWPSHRDLG